MSSALQGTARLGAQTVHIGGHTMHLHPHDDAVSAHLRAHGYWEALETKIALHEIHPGNVVVDAGANVGYYPLLFARLVGERGAVFAFEPDPENFALLQGNVEANGYRNVTLVRGALSDRSGRASLFLDDVNRGDHRLYDSATGRGHVPVETIRLDDYVAAFERHIDFIKLDIQGTEPAAVSGMDTILRRNDGLVLMTEFWPYGLRESGTRPLDYLRLLLDYGFTLYVADEWTQSVEIADVQRLLGIEGQRYV